MDLSNINTLAILIIIIVIYINFLLSAWSLKYSIENRGKLMDNKVEVNKINDDIKDYINKQFEEQKRLEVQTRNILDLDEFKHLHPEIKALYKKYIINELLYKITPYINDEYLKNKDKLKEEDISAAIKSILDQLQSVTNAENSYTQSENTSQSDWYTQSENYYTQSESTYPKTRYM